MADDRIKDVEKARRAAEIESYERRAQETLSNEQKGLSEARSSASGEGGSVRRFLRFGWRKTEKVRSGAAYGAGVVGGAIAQGAPSLRKAKSAVFEMAGGILPIIFFIMALAAALADILTNFALPPQIRIFMYGLLWGISWLFIWQERSLKTTATSFLFSLTPFMTPYIINGLQAILPSGIISRDTIVGISVSIFSLFWIWAIALKGHGWSRKIAAAIIFVIIASMAWQAAKTINPDYLPKAQVENVLQRTVGGYNEAISAIFSLPNKTLEAYQRVKNFTGITPIDSKIEESIGEPLGVEIQISKASYGSAALIGPSGEQKTPIFTASDPIEITVPVKVTTRQDITLTPFCRANQTNGTANFGPTTSWIIETQGGKFDDTNAISCKFLPGQLNRTGSSIVRVGVEFTWQTNSRLVRYFIDRDWALGQTKLNNDPLDVLQVQDKKPVAQTTPGPALLGIATTPEYVIALPKDRPLSGLPLLHIELKQSSDPKIGTGVIKNITDLSIYLPDGLELDTSNCDRAFRSAGLQAFQGEESRGVSYNTYVLDQKVENIKGSTTFNCRFKQPDVPKLLGDNLLSIVTIRARAEYGFSAEKNLPEIIVRKE